ncbi:MAG: hypothetical protein HDQ88_09550 [Clostridia bacterium]|nr:hypothetical protein [Clostridia bacterium]
MSSCCDDREFMRGGVIVDATISNSTIQGSTITDSTFNNGTITNLSSIDAPSAKKIADAISKLGNAQLAPLAEALANAMAALSKEQLAALAKALADAMLSAQATAPTETLADKGLPATMVGTRDLNLGRPAKWLKMGNYAVPAYNEG